MPLSLRESLEFLIASMLLNTELFINFWKYKLLFTRAGLQRLTNEYTVHWNVVALLAGGFDKVIHTVKNQFRDCAHGPRATVVRHFDQHREGVGLSLAVPILHFEASWVGGQFQSQVAVLFRRPREDPAVGHGDHLDGPSRRCVLASEGSGPSIRRVTKRPSVDLRRRFVVQLFVAGSRVGLPITQFERPQHREHSVPHFAGNWNTCATDRLTTCYEHERENRLPGPHRGVTVAPSCPIHGLGPADVPSQPLAVEATAAEKCRHGWAHLRTGRGRKVLFCDTVGGSFVHKGLSAHNVRCERVNLVVSVRRPPEISEVFLLLFGVLIPEPPLGSDWGCAKAKDVSDNHC
eukprot:m.445416 g.445416  ORF g.445416 m.445416 type:complete len:348 (+) comp19225_c0_seq1:763-1806(+)